MSRSTHSRRGLRWAAIASASIAALVAGLVGASPALGLGFKDYACYSTARAYGGSSTTAANTATTAGSYDCGDSRVRVRYTVGETSYWSTWSQAFANVTKLVPSGSVGTGGQHTVTGWLHPVYAPNFPFTT